jgi:uncharacterized protein YkwD
MRRKLTLAAAAIAVAVLAMACSPQERHVAEEINRFRADNHVAPLQWEESAYAKAVSWSQHMAAEGHLSHSKLSDGIGSGWKALGENVAYNSSLDGAIHALEQSPGHRANLLNPAFTHMAVGAVQVNGVWWVTQVFIAR